jgi:hypothetical protein
LKLYDTFQSRLGEIEHVVQQSIVGARMTPNERRRNNSIPMRACDIGTDELIVLLRNRRRGTLTQLFMFPLSMGPPQDEFTLPAPASLWVAILG